MPERWTSVEMLARLVSFDTTSRLSNLDLIGWVRGYLDGHGVTYRISESADGRHANLHAVIGDGSGGIALSGHVDTVPVDGQAWTGDPFTLRPDGDRLIARGSCDMKGFVACALAAVPDLVGRRLDRPVHLFLSFDEEVRMAGAHRLVADIAESGLKPDMCIVGEPSLMQPVLAHKARLALQVRATGVAGHSSLPAQGVNAIHAAAEAVAWVGAEARRRAVDGPHDALFDPPHTTMQVGTFTGGSVLNIIPETAEFQMEWRTIPADDPHAEIERLRSHIAARVDQACGFEVDIIDLVPGMALGTDHPLADLVRQVSGSNSTGGVSYATEGGIYQQAGIPTIICGPGSVEQAHRADEWIATGQLAACDAFIGRLADRLTR